MEIFGKGVLLKGTSGVGKSETALALIDRGHLLIADDIVIFEKLDSQRIVGNCPKNLLNLLEVRGLGILNVSDLFGPQILKNKALLDVVIDLISQASNEPVLSPLYSQESIMGLSVPKITLPISPGRNMALLIETAVRHFQFSQSSKQVTNL